VPERTLGYVEARSAHRPRRSRACRAQEPRFGPV